MSSIRGEIQRRQATNCCDSFADTSIFDSHFCRRQDCQQI